MGLSTYPALVYTSDEHPIVHGRTAVATQNSMKKLTSYALMTNVRGGGRPTDRSNDDVNCKQKMSPTKLSFAERRAFL